MPKNTADDWDATAGNNTDVGGINQLTQADVNRRLALIGQRGGVATNLANLPLAGLNAVGPLAQSFTELPFIPLAAAAAIAFTPLGRTTIGSTTDTTKSNPGVLDTLKTVVSLGKTAAGIAGGLGPLTGVAAAAPAST